VFAMLLTPDGPASAAAAPTDSSVGGHPERPQPAPSFPSTLGIRTMAPSNTIQLSLSATAPASLELFDLAGRRLWSRDVSELGQGEHVVRVADGAQLPAGVYFARLTQAGHAATVRLALTH